MKLNLPMTKEEIQQAADESLMRRMEANETFVNDVNRDDNGNGINLDMFHEEHIAIYNELTRRGWRYNSKIGEWEHIESR